MKDQQEDPELKDEELENADGAGIGTTPRIRFGRLRGIDSGNA